MPGIDKLLELEKTKGAAELHLSVGQRPKLRIRGEVLTLATNPVSTEESLRETLHEIAPPFRVLELRERHETQFGYGVDGVGRFRCHFFQQNLGLGAVFRTMPDKIPALSELRLPGVVETFARLRDGLVLVAGPPRSGKTTLLSALVSVINHTHRKHVLCIEEPIEFIHPVRKAIVTQREVGAHSGSFRSAMESAIYLDCEVLMVGDLPDPVSIAMALEAADRGVLVLAGIVADGVVGALERLLDPIAAPAKPRMRSLLADTLRGVVALRMAPSANGKDRFPVPEILQSNPGVAGIVREGDFERLPSMVSSGRGEWYHPADLALTQLVADGRLSAEEAYLLAQNKGTFERQVSR
ncbi:MAG: Flp pilus assembly complex ATPase component TadA [Planctomycetes bacterium]|nr:Flp pilus assembly complex ATPase component TadA [Planctomycetota bacterium]